MSEILRKRYDFLVSAPTRSDQPASEILDYVGELIDLSADLGHTRGAELAIEHCDRLKATGSLAAEEIPILHYFEANAWSVLWLMGTGSMADMWLWKDVAFENQIRRLRQARRSPAFRLLDSVRRSEILTNLANCLDTLGRFVEAIEIYDEALDICPDHGMARGNLGICLAHYGYMLLGLDHQAGCCSPSVFFVRAWTNLGGALNSQLDPKARAGFEAEWRRLDDIVRGPESEDTTMLDGDVPGETEEEKNYWEWCLFHRLCLNPLNDLDLYGDAAIDILLLPPVTDHTDRGTYVLDLFNEIKQDYATARFMLYEALNAKVPHFSDHNVALVNTLSYAAYSLPIEKARIAFRMAYSLFDKMAFLVSGYLDLKIRPERVNFRKLWFENEEQKNALKPYFDAPREPPPPRLIRAEQRSKRCGRRA